MKEPNTDFLSLPQEDITKLAYNVRRDLIELMFKTKSGHLDTCLSLVEIWLTLVKSSFFKYDPENGAWADRDRLFLSEGHACPLQYVVNGHLGYYSVERVFKELRQPKTPFQGHTVRNLNYGFENSNGSLGIGLWQAYGHALEANGHVFCIAGDGEFQEPPAFSLLNVTHNLKPLGNYHLIINNNGLAQDSEVDIGPLTEVARSYNWQVLDVDGHNISALASAFHEAVNNKKQPSLILCKTIKGYGGDPEKAGKLGSHGVPPKTGEDLKCYLAGLEMMRLES